MTYHRADWLCTGVGGLEVLLAIANFIAGAWGQGLFLTGVGILLGTLAYYGAVTRRNHEAWERSRQDFLAALRRNLE